MSERINVRQYKKITRSQRLQLLTLILQEKNTIKRAAQLVGIGASTARMILKKYQHTGDIFESKTDVKTRHIIEKIKKEKCFPEVVLPTQPAIQENPDPVAIVPVFYLFYPTCQAVWAPYE